MGKILSIKNKDEEKFLRKSTVPFDFNAFSKAEINDLVRMMRKTMEDANGIGLAANQIGLNMSVFVARADRKFYAVFNPEILKPSKDKMIIEEGCLSVPNDFLPVTRSEKVTLIGFDKNGKKLKIKAWGLLSCIFQHEVDHLNGKLFLDHVKRR